MKSKKLKTVLRMIGEELSQNNAKLNTIISALSEDKIKPATDIEVHFDEVEKLPEKWCVLKTLDNWKEVGEWFQRNSQASPNITDYGSKMVYIGDYLHYPAPIPDKYHAHSEIQKGYTEISFETFKRLVLKEDERIPNIIPGTYYEYIGNETGLLVLTDIKEHDNKLLVYGTCVNNPTSYDIAVVGQHRVWAKSSLKKWSGTHTRKQI